jgi:hypothetical protein
MTLMTNIMASTMEMNIIRAITRKKRASFLIYSIKHKSQFQNAPFWPISALGSNFNPRNTPCIPVVEIFSRLELDQTETF